MSSTLSISDKVEFNYIYSTVQYLNTCTVFFLYTYSLFCIIKKYKQLHLTGYQSFFFLLT